MQEYDVKYDLKHIMDDEYMLVRYRKLDHGPGIPLQTSQVIFLKHNEIDELIQCLQKMK
jgi:hypothetical protein